MPSYIILGAGVSGLAAAWRLLERGHRVTIVESRDTVGGLAGTVREGPYCIDFGPHSFFSEDETIRKTVLDLFSPPLTPNPRKVKFLYRGKYLDYPLTAESVLFQMGLASGIRAGLSFLKGKIAAARVGAATDEQSVEDWALENFGEHLYLTFFKPYTEQFWKVPCRELSARSIPSHTRTSFMNTLRVLLKRKATRGGTSLIEREQLPTFYPDTGYAEISEKIAERVAKNGGEILLGSRAVEIAVGAGAPHKVIIDEAGRRRTIEAERIISTLPLSILIEMLRPSPPAEVIESAGKLDYRALVVLGMVTAKQDILDCGYMYVLDRPYNRISEMNKFSPKTSPPGENILAVEIPCLRESETWRAGAEELFQICIGSLAGDGILGPGDVKKLLLVKAPHAYPIYRKGYKPHLDRVLAYIRSLAGLDTLGRSGEFIYMDADVCIRRAFERVGLWN